MDEQRRQDEPKPLRVQYLGGEAPVAVVGQHKYPVTEISQFEMSLSAECHTFRLFETFNAIVYFPDKAKIGVDGYVLRAGGNRVVIQLIRGFSESRILLERQQLGQRLIATPIPGGPDRRRHPRLRYPANEQPCVLIDNGRFAVVEISEGGLVFSSRDQVFSPGQSVFAVIRFLDNAYIAVQGEVVRMIDNLVAVRLNRGLSPQRIQLETRQFGGEATSGSTPGEERRRHIRVPYPRELEPNLLVEGVAYPVIEISTSSVVVRTRDMRFRLRQPVAAMLKYDDTTKMIASGIVYRMTTDRVVIKLHVGLPESWVQSERERLARYRPNRPKSTAAPKNLLGFNMQSLRQ